MADHASTASNAQDEHPFEIYFKELRIPRPNPTKEDIEAAIAAAEDDPGVRNHHQPFALKQGQTGKQERITYIFVNGVLKKYHFDVLKNANNACKILHRLGVDTHELVGTAEMVYDIDSDTIDQDLEVAELAFDNAKENVALCREQVKIHRQLKEVEEEQRKLEEKRRSLKEEEARNKDDQRQLRQKLRKDGVYVYLGLAPKRDA